jgi:hypothetical protein
VGTHETVTLLGAVTAQEVALRWPADNLTWISNVHQDEGAVSLLLTTNIGERNTEELAEALFDEFASIERIAWTRLGDTNGVCTAAVYDRSPETIAEALDLVIKVSTGRNQWHLARDAVREQADVPVQTWYEITDGESVVQTHPRENTPY